MIEMVVLGVFVGAVLLTAVGAAARVLDAGSRVSDAAEIAATSMSLGTGADRARELAMAFAPDAESISIETAGDQVTVVVTIRVGLIGPAGSPVTTTVTGRAIAVSSPHMSAGG